MLNPNVDLLQVKDKKDFNIYSPRISELYQSDPKDDLHPSSASIIKSKQIFDKVENIGSKMTYRCVNHKDCKD